MSDNSFRIIFSSSLTNNTNCKPDKQTFLNCKYRFEWRKFWSFFFVYMRVFVYFYLCLYVFVCVRVSFWVCVRLCMCGFVCVCVRAWYFNTKKFMKPKLNSSNILMAILESFLFFFFFFLCFPEQQTLFYFYKVGSTDLFICLCFFYFSNFGHICQTSFLFHS